MQHSNSRRWRWGRWLLASILLVALGLVAVLVGLNTDYGREAVRHRVNLLLADTFRGELVIDRIGSIDFRGVRDVDARVVDPQGRQVALARALNAQIALPTLLVSLASKDTGLQVLLPEVDCAELEVALIEDADAGFSLVAAFDSAEPEAASGSAPTASTSPGPSVRLSQIKVEHATVTYQKAQQDVDAQPLALDLRALAAGLFSDDAGVQVALHSAFVAPARWPQEMNGELRLRGGLRVPSAVDAPLGLEASLQGQLNGSPVDARAVLHGDAVWGTLQVAQIRARDLARHWPELKFQGDSMLGVSVHGALPLLNIGAELFTPAGTLLTRADIALAPELEVHAEVIADHIDLSQLVGKANISEVGLEADVYAVLDGDTWLGAQWVNVPAFELEDQMIPDLQLWGTFSAGPQSQAADLGLLGAEPGLQVRAKVKGRRSVGGPPNADPVQPSAASAEGELAIDLDRSARLVAHGVTGRGQLRAQGQWALAGPARAELALNLPRVAYRGLSLRQLQLTANGVSNAEGQKASGRLAFDVAGGHVRVDARAGPDLQVLNARLSQIDLAAAARTINSVRNGKLDDGDQAPFMSGRADVALNVLRRAGTLGGVLEVHAREVQRGAVRGDLDARFELAGKRLDGDAEARLGRLGNARLSLQNVILPKDPTDGWREGLLGRVSLNGRMDLASASQLAGNPLGVERVGGTLGFDLKAASEMRGALPLVDVNLSTQSFVVVQQRPGGPGPKNIEAARAAEPLALEGIDAELLVRLAPDAHEVVANLILKDKSGPLGRVAGKLELPAKSRFASLLSVPQLGSAPLQVNVEVPKRALGSLPRPLKPALSRVFGADALRTDGGTSATLAARGSLEGSFGDPQVRLQAWIAGLRSQARQLPLDLSVELEATPKRGVVELEATRNRAKLASIAAHWKGDVRLIDLTRQNHDQLEIDLRAECTELPLQLVPDTALWGVSGAVSGELQLTGLGRDARLAAKFKGHDMKVGDVVVSALDVVANANDQRASAQANIVTAGGELKATFGSGLRWGARWLPETGQAHELNVTARDFEIGVVRPLLGHQVNELTGRLDAHLKLEQAAGARRMQGQAQLREGVVQLPAIGQRFSQIEALVRVNDGHVKLENFSAAGITGKLLASGNAELDGAQLRSATLGVQIPKRNKLPLTLEGVALGDAWGNVDLSYRSAPRSSELRVTVTKFELIAPEASGGSLQSLDERADVRVGVRRGDGAFAVLPTQPIEKEGSAESAADAEPAIPLRTTVVLRNVTVRRGDSVQARLAGELAVTEGDVTGRIEIAGGNLDVQGKRFEIESGVVTFDGEDSANPTIAATARWDSPTGHSVFAQYIGDVENGRIKLYSEPPLSHDEIASLLLFGTPDGSFGAQESDQASMAVSAAGGTVATGLNQALDEFTQLDVSARVDTSTGNPRPELVFQVSPRVATKVSRAVGEPTAGEAPDRTFVTLELRLKRSWALSAVLGDHGASALDLIWRRRY